MKELNSSELSMVYGGQNQTEAEKAAAERLSEQNGGDSYTCTTRTAEIDGKEQEVIVCVRDKGLSD